MSDVLLAPRGVHKTYTLGQRSLEVLRGVDLEVVSLDPVEFDLCALLDEEDEDEYGLDEDEEDEDWEDESYIDEDYDEDEEEEKY